MVNPEKGYEPGPRHEEGEDFSEDDGGWDNENDYGFDGWAERDDDRWDNENDYGFDGWG